MIEKALRRIKNKCPDQTDHNTADGIGGKNNCPVYEIYFCIFLQKKRIDKRKRNDNHDCCCREFQCVQQTPVKQLILK